jgi:hypothetical protein
MDESGLAAVHPELRIRFSRPVGYIELLESVQLHGYHLMRSNGRVLEPSEIATDWYERVYLPALEAIERERLADAYPETTEADRFLCVVQRRRELLPEWGRDALDEAYRRARADAHGGLRRGALRRFAA